jgi:hypothetical protein
MEALARGFVSVRGAPPRQPGKDVTPLAEEFLTTYDITVQVFDTVSRSLLFIHTASRSLTASIARTVGASTGFLNCAIATY